MRRVTGAADLGARRAWLWRNKSLFHSSTQYRQPRLLVDVSAIIRHDAETGIQRVVRAVWSELSKRSGKGFLAQPIYATKRHGYCYAPADFLERNPRWLGKEPVSLGPNDKFLGLDLSAHLLPKYRQQLRAWRNQGGTVHIVVYDVLPLQQAEWFTAAATKNFRKWLQLLEQEADQAICISADVERQLATHLHGARCPSIGRLHMGADMSASRPSRGLSESVRTTLERMHEHPTILMVGTIEPRKGYEVALRAFEFLWQSRPAATAPELVIVGKSGWKTSSLQRQLMSHIEYGNRLHWLDRVSDEGLCLLYEMAKGVLVTSRGEGFGLPLIEAAAHQRYVLARDLPVFREHRLPNVLYFSEDAPERLARRLEDLLSTSIRPPIDKFALPSWSECVDGLLVEMGIQPAIESDAARPLCRVS